MYGLFYEHGPLFISNYDSSLSINPFRWTRFANMLYIESPAGVGFSITDDESYSTDDFQTATDNLAALESFFQKFPQFFTNSLFISGESYAGIYVPAFSDEVLSSGRFNFKGFLVGNPVTDSAIDSVAYVPFLHGHGVISDQLFDNATSSCNGTYDSSYSPLCASVLLQVDAIMSDVNVYDIYRSCFRNGNAVLAATNHVLMNRVQPKGTEIPCIDSTGLSKFAFNPFIDKADSFEARLSWMPFTST